MSDNEALLNDLFAYRIQIMDIITEEYSIIRRLKTYLTELGYNNINAILYSFYCYFDIPMTLSEIENVQPNNYSNILFINMNYTNNLEQLNEPINDIDDDMPPLVEATNNEQPTNIFPNILNILLGMPSLQNVYFNQVLVPPNNNLSDVIITTDENSLNNLSILKILKEQIEKCTICMEEMNEEDEYFDIECKHIFHKACLETYLKNYNHICPVCRKEIGNSQPIL